MGFPFERVGFHYPESDGVALTEFGLHVRAGEFVMITGASGAGKSTLTKLLSRFYDPTCGRVLLDGVSLADLDLRTVRDNIALVPQEAAVLHTTVAENIAFGTANASPAAIVSAARGGRG